MKKIILIICLVNIMGLALGLKPLDKFIVDRKNDRSGNEIIAVQVPAGRPPKGYVRDSDSVDMEQLLNTRNVTIISDVPSYDWSYGCSATAAAMMMAYYDRNGYPNMYTGPTNNGVMPLDNSIWNAGSGGEGGDGECPLSATNQGIDGRTIRGHVEDYWVTFNSTADDPYMTNGWSQHELGDCTGDFMGTNQKYWNNTDGATTFYTNNSGYALHDFTGGEDDSPRKKDGTRGLKQFIESRGYQVNSNYNQLINGYDDNTNGFTFAQFMQEIDNDRPVLIHVEGHTMLGIGYNSATEEIYINNTWDYSTHTMEWGGMYYEMAQYAVSVIELGPNVNNGDIAVHFNLFDSYGDGWTNNGDQNYLNFNGAIITLSDGSEGRTTFYLAPGDYDYTYTENDGWGQENSWTITLDDGSLLASGRGEYGSQQNLSFTVPAQYTNPLEPSNLIVTRNSSNIRLDWDSVLQDIEGTDISEEDITYRVEWSEDVDFSIINSSSTTSNTYFIHYNPSNSKLFYRVIAIVD